MYIQDQIPRSHCQKLSTQTLYSLSVFSKSFCIEFIKIKNVIGTGKNFRVDPGDAFTYPSFSHIMSTSHFRIHEIFFFSYFLVL
eukprot:UN02231